jgi:hypothetical protein
MLVKGSDLNNTRQIKNKRAGVIVYTFFEGRLYFLLGVDRRTREYTDFGGGCKNNETLTQGAWREFQEESCGVFSILDRDCLNSSIAVTSEERDVAIFFIEAPTALLDIAPPLFNHVQNGNVLKARKCMENIAIEWVEDEDFAKMAFDRGCHMMWSRIQKFLITNAGEYDDLKLKIALKRAISVPTNIQNIHPQSLILGSFKGTLSNRSAGSAPCSYTITPGY